MAFLEVSIFYTFHLSLDCHHCWIQSVSFRHGCIHAAGKEIGLNVRLKGEKKKLRKERCLHCSGKCKAIPSSTVYFTMCSMKGRNKHVSNHMFMPQKKVGIKM